MERKRWFVADWGWGCRKSHEEQNGDANEQRSEGHEARQAEGGDYWSVG
jgi:hypothetical protein